MSRFFNRGAKPCGAFSARWLAALLVAASIFAVASATEADPRKEYKLKAEFLYNFAKFVTWPNESLPAEGEPIVFCLVGSGPVHSLLDDLMKGRHVKERGIQVRPISSPEFVRDCHVLFAPNDADDILAPILEGAKTASVLTVGESESFYEAGGIIRFILSGGRLRFDINIAAASTVKLKISSQLLKLARTVEK
jgi:hypothetical protein